MEFLDMGGRSASQIAPGRDLEELDEQGRPGRPRTTPPAIASAISGGLGLPQGQFAGAQTIQPKPQAAPSPTAGLANAPQPAPTGMAQPMAPAQAPPLNPPTGTAQPIGQPGGFAPQTPTTPAFNPGAAPAGFDATKWGNAEHQSPKYIVGRDMASIADQVRAIPDEAGRKAFVQQRLNTLIPQIEAQGWKVHEVKGEKIMISGGPNNEPAHWGDAFEDIEGKANPQWHVDNGSGGGQQQSPMGIQSAIMGTAPQLGGGDFSTRLRQQMMEQLAKVPGLAQLA